MHTDVSHFVVPDFCIRMGQSFSVDAVDGPLCGDGTVLTRFHRREETGFLKAFPFRTATDASFEANLILHLHGGGAPVPRVLRTVLGEAVGMVSWAGRQIPVIALSEVRGAPVRSLDGALSARLSSVLAQLHGQSHTFPCGAAVAAQRGISLPEHGGLEGDWPVLEAASAALVRRWGALWDQYRAGLRPEDRCLLHGDFSHRNLLVHPENGLGVIDFSDARMGWAIEDLGFLVHSHGWIAGTEGLDLALRYAIPEYCRSCGRPEDVARDTLLGLLAAAHVALVFALKRPGPESKRDRNLALAAAYLERCERLEYRERNRRGWAELARMGHPYCQPFGEEHLAQARDVLDPRGWIDWRRHRRVLLLGGGGGQHSLLLAALGLDVVVVDLCQEQLEMDRETCARHGYRVSTIEADMTDLQDIDLGPCDLVYHAMSSQFVPDLRPVYRGVVRHLTAKGAYVGHHRNPLLGQAGRGKEGSYAIVRPHGARHPWERGHLWPFSDGDHDLGTVQFVHSLTDLLGTACEEGLLIDAFWEKTGSGDEAPPGTREHLYQAIPSAVWFRARRARRSDEMVLR